jgi:hypothetical protein
MLHVTVNSSPKLCNARTNVYEIWHVYSDAGTNLSSQTHPYTLPTAPVQRHSKEFSLVGCGAVCFW